MAQESKSASAPAKVYVVADGLSTVGKNGVINEKTAVTAADFEKQRDFDELVDRGILVQRAAPAKAQEAKTDGAQG
jgi:hypothetical protein